MSQNQAVFIGGPADLVRMPLPGRTHIYKFPVVRRAATIGWYPMNTADITNNMMEASYTRGPTIATADGNVTTIFVFDGFSD